MCLTLNLKVMPLECEDEIWRLKTMGLPGGEEITIVGPSMWLQSKSVVKQFRFDSFHLTDYLATFSLLI